MVEFGCLLKKHKDWVSNRDARIANFHVYKCNAFLFYNTRVASKLEPLQVLCCHLYRFINLICVRPIPNARRCLSSSLASDNT